MNLNPEILSQLSPETLSALMEFYDEKNKIKTNLEKDGFEEIEEDWELSQFFYTKETADKLILLIGNYAKKHKKGMFSSKFANLTKCIFEENKKEEPKVEELQTEEPKIETNQNKIEIQIN